MIKPFEYYLKEKDVAVSSPNISMAKSLIQKAEIRLKRASSNKIEESEASIVFEDIYESLREASQSLMEIKGYKPYSHEALISFVKENKFLSEEKTNIFNNYRILRNNSVYRAETISVKKCIEALQFAQQTIPELKNKLDEIMNIKQ